MTIPNAIRWEWSQWGNLGLPRWNYNGHAYEPLAPTPDFGAVLRKIKADPTGIFWG